jgi:hypothetical protein
MSSPSECWVMISGLLTLNTWHKLHEAITRNHQCRGITNLLARVKYFMDTVFPFLS